jgi:hypothetical protein
LDELAMVAPGRSVAHVAVGVAVALTGVAPFVVLVVDDVVPLDDPPLAVLVPEPQRQSQCRAEHRERTCVIPHNLHYSSSVS